VRQGMQVEVAAASLHRPAPPRRAAAHTGNEYSNSVLKTGGHFLLVPAAVRRFVWSLRAAASSSS